MAAILRRSVPLQTREVSILVLLDWEWRHIPKGNQIHMFHVVSILVLLDWEWRPLTDSRPRLIRRCFNPCSVGLGMAAL